MITMKVYDGWARVFKDNIEVKSFNLLAEDYAITMAEDYAYKLRMKEK